DGGQLELPGVGHFLFDLARHVARQQGRLIVRHGSRVDDDADLAARLNGEGFLDPPERVADALEVLEPLHVALEHLAPRPGTRPGERVGRIDQRRQDGLGAHLLVMRRDGVHDLRLRRFADTAAQNERAIALQPNYPEAYINLGNAWKALGRANDAQAAYER